jgi:ParB family chromosome partitioning protein
MPGQRKALGRGLSALLGTPDLESDRLRDIDIDRIVPDPNQPRTSFDKTGLEELAASIRTHGVVQPIVIRPLQDGVFQIVAGERRWRATQLAGLETMPALVRDTHEHHALELALVENLQREDLNAIDQARAYQRLLSEFSLTQEKLASRVGKSRASVANILRLLKLPEEVQKWLQEGVINAGHAKALLSLPDADAILESAREIIKGSYSVRQAEALVSKPKPQPGSSASGENPAEDPNVRAAIRALERVLGTKVAIRQPGGKGKGKIEIHFHSQGELNRLYNGLIETRF